MERVVEIVRKEIRQLRRDRQMLPLLLAVPVLQLVLFGFAISTDIKHLRVAVCDLDRSAASRAIVRALGSSEYFDIAGFVDAYGDIDRWLDQGRASIGLVMPPTLDRDLASGRTARIQVLLDGTDATAGTVALAYLARFLQEQSVRLLAARSDRRGPVASAGPRIEAETRFWYNPLLLTVVFMVPGAMCVIVGMSATIATALAIVREREIGTMEQLIVTPLRPWELMVGKTIPFLAVGIFNMTAVLIANALIFRVPMRGSLMVLYGTFALFLVCSLAVGLLISTVSRTQQQAILSAFFFLMPNFLLSGFIFPIENMPVVLQWVTFLLPLRYHLAIVRGVFLKGLGLAEISDQIWPLAALTVAIMALAVWRFQKRLD